MSHRNREAEAAALINIGALTVEKALEGAVTGCHLNPDELALQLAAQNAYNRAHAQAEAPVVDVDVDGPFELDQ